MTKYFTAWDDFDVHTIDTNVSGWTTRGTAAPNGYAPAYGATSVVAYKRRYLNFKTNSSGVPMRNLVSWNTIDGDANRATVELLGGFAKDTTTATDLTLAVRGVGASGAAASEGYLARCEMAGNIYISKRSSATAITTVATTAFTFSAGKAYFVRFRANGTSLKLRVWDAALGMAGEPTTWNIDTTDASFSSAGWVGLGGFDGGTGNLIAPWNFLAVATNGDTAVAPRTNAEYTAWLAKQDQLHCVVAKMKATGYDSSGSPYTKVVKAYVANHGYTSQQQDSPSLQHFDACITGIPTFSREMPAALSGQATVNIGRLRVTNPASSTSGAGRRDDWLRIHWLRDGFELLLGHPSWPLHDFRHLLRGRLGNPTAPDLRTIEFPIADMSELFNADVQTSLFTSGDYINQRKPIYLGQISRTDHGGGQIEPPLTDSTNLIYTLCDVATSTWYDSTTSYLKCYDNQVELRTAALTCSAVAGNEITTSAPHGMVVNYLWRSPVAGALPTPLANDTDYWVQSTSTTSKFTLSATRGGAVIVLTSATLVANTSRGYGYTVTNTAPTTLQLAATPAGRITVLGIQLGQTLEAMYLDIAARVGLTANYLNTSGFSYDAGYWVDTRKHSALDVLSAIAAGTLSWFGFSPEGLLQCGAIELPSSTAVLSLTRSSIAGIGLAGRIRQVDFSKAQITYAPWFLPGGPFQTGSQAALQGRTFRAPVTYGAGVPLDNYPAASDADGAYAFESLYTDTSAIFTGYLDLYAYPLGIFNLTTTLRALVRDDGGALCVGDTISIDFPRLGFKLWTGSDDPSPDNTADFDGRLCVVIGIAVNLDAKPTEKVRLTVFRRIPGYYPTANLN